MPKSTTVIAPTNPALSVLQPLVGRWTATINWSEKRYKLVGGARSVQAPASFDWALDGCVLVQTSGGPSGPVARWIIGRDDTSGAFAVLYTDNRGVSRVYEMSFADDTWKLWRNSPQFHQRFIGRISSDRNDIEACWEKSEDGKVWENDFNLSFTRAE